LCAGLSALDELKMLAEEAKAKGGAQHCDDMVRALQHISTHCNKMGVFIIVTKN